MIAGGESIVPKKKKKKKKKKPPKSWICEDAPGLPCLNITLPDLGAMHVLLVAKEITYYSPRKTFEPSHDNNDDDDSGLLISLP
jgi:hypothetical protein